ncbi:MAG: winged helix-turn-helix domain-containing protein [Acidimicrobiales bacterium]
MDTSRRFPTMISVSPPSTYVAIADVAQRPLRLATSPLATVGRLTLDTLREGRSTLDPWRAAVRAALEPADAAALAPIVGQVSGWTLIPDCVTPPPMSFGVSMDDQLECVAATSPDVLLAELVDIATDAASIQRWSIVLRDPSQWLTAYVGAMQRAWSAVRVLWERSGPLFERELERVGTASARGAIPELVASLQPLWPVSDGAWWLPGTKHPRLRLPPEGLVLVPILAGPTSRGLWEAGEDVLTHVGYPIPGARRFFGPPRIHGSSLEALIGEQRARILRRLDRPATAGKIAELIVGTPSAATHHLTALEKAGLAARERQGRFVVVRRTARGTALLALYE